MNKTTIIIGLVVLAAVLFFRFGLKPSSSELNNNKRSDQNQKTTKLIENDKMILIKNIKFEYLRKAIEQFCNMYNQASFVAMPRLYLCGNEYVITFPYNIDFERYCYFINYLENAHELCLLPDYKPEVKAWCSTKTGDAWMKEKTVNKKVMIYIPEWDEEHDNVYLTTQDNLGFKMGFAVGEATQVLDKPVIQFETNPIDFHSLTNKEKIDFD